MKRQACTESIRIIAVAIVDARMCERLSSSRSKEGFRRLQTTARGPDIQVMISNNEELVYDNLKISLYEVHRLG